MYGTFPFSPVTSVRSRTVPFASHGRALPGPKAASGRRPAPFTPESVRPRVTQARKTGMLSAEPQIDPEVSHCDYPTHPEKFEKMTPQLLIIHQYDNSLCGGVVRSVALDDLHYQPHQVRSDFHLFAIHRGQHQVAFCLLSDEWRPLECLPSPPLPMRLGRPSGSGPATPATQQQVG